MSRHGNPSTKVLGDVPVKRDAGGAPAPGVDISLLEDSLQLTPWQRLVENDRTLAMVRMLEQTAVRDLSLEALIEAKSALDRTQDQLALIHLKEIQAKKRKQ